jgi:hypothetical protein
MFCKCGSNRIVHLSGKCNDMCVMIVEHLDIEKDGYAPRISNISGGDYISFDFCADCGMIQDFTPLSDEFLKDCIDHM